MKTLPHLNLCQSFLDAQLKPGRPLVPGRPDASRLRAITISRQLGCGALAVADHIAARLNTALPPETAAWTVFDRNLIEQVLTDHHLPVRFAKYLPEDRVSEVRDVMEELFGVHPSTWTIVEQTAETILRLVQLGNVILLGRAANLITARLPGVFHVRLVAPLAGRIDQVCRQKNLTPAAARELIDQEDSGRSRYLKKYFAAEPDDPLQYHLILNTGLTTPETAADLIVTAATAVSLLPVKK
jgi:cytidylate kinase